MSCDGWACNGCYECLPKRQAQAAAEQHEHYSRLNQQARKAEQQARDLQKQLEKEAQQRAARERAEALKKLAKDHPILASAAVLGTAAAGIWYVATSAGKCPECRSALESTPRPGQFIASNFYWHCTSCRHEFRAYPDDEHDREFKKRLARLANAGKCPQCQHELEHTPRPGQILASNLYWHCAGCGHEFRYHENDEHERKFGKCWENNSNESMSRLPNTVEKSKTLHATKGTIEEVGHMVANYFRGRGLDPKQQQIAGAGGCGWWLTEGSARIYVFVQDAPGGPVLRITSPIVLVPHHEQLEFMRHLLDMNANLACCALAISDNTVLVVAQRHTAQLDQKKLDDMMWNVAYVADLLDDKLITEYGAQRYNL